MALLLNYKCCELTESLLSSATILSYHCSITSCLLPHWPPFHIDHGRWSPQGLSLLAGELCPPLTSLSLLAPSEALSIAVFPTGLSAVHMLKDSHLFVPWRLPSLQHSSWHLVNPLLGNITRVSDGCFLGGASLCFIVMNHHMDISGHQCITLLPFSPNQLNKVQKWPTQCVDLQE